ncbi:MAG: ABC transporter ATP-binding protein [Polyangiaceae bacterium]|nr:ABC transporter ATP-binding protein [Polyangiaceae bacterium]
MTSPLLQLTDLSVQFRTSAGIVRAVDGVSYAIGHGKTLAVVGESGCGKSVTAMTILRLIEKQRGEVTAGRVEFQGRDLLELDEEAMRGVRGNEIAMIFQEPMTSLNPVYTVGNQIGEALELHRGLQGEEQRAEAIRYLHLVGIPSPEQRFAEYPHQLSGGMRQRVMIAMALCCRPKLLIADEPTTALDVTIQAQILTLMRGLQAKLGMSILLITHDLGVVASMAEDVAIMYAGRIVEQGSVYDIFERPKHPYTAGLLRSLPTYDASGRHLEPIPGNVPDALGLPTGCRFHPRCRFRLPKCATVAPALVEHKNGQKAACFVTEADPDLDLLHAETPNHAPERMEVKDA